MKWKPPRERNGNETPIQPSNATVEPVEQKNYLSKLRFDPEADYVLYYIKVRYKNRQFYKIGVTSNNLQKRYGDDHSKIEKILFEQRVIGALKAEKEILERFKEHLFPLAIFRDGNGASEFFDADVLGIDQQ